MLGVLLIRILLFIGYYMRVRKLPDGVCWLVSTSLSKQRMEPSGLGRKAVDRLG